MIITELKQIQLFRQHITNKTKKLSVVQDLNGLQCQFLINVFNSLRIRCSDNITTENFSDGLMKDGILKMSYIGAELHGKKPNHFREEVY